MNFLRKLKYKRLISELKNKFQSFSNDEVMINEIYDLILPYKKIIFDYFKEYLNFVYDYGNGQITESQDFGKFLKDILIQNNLNVIEFGTWNGLGSTKIIFENSKKSDSIEINPLIHGIAKKNLLPINPKNKLLVGRIIELNKTKINLKESFFSYEFNKKRSMIDMWLGHLVHLIFTCETELILENLQESYDLLLIDGGGLTTYDEFLIILPKIKKYIFLDDIDGIKGKKIFEFLKKHKNYNLIFNSTSRQSCAFKKI